MLGLVREFAQGNNVFQRTVLALRLGPPLNTGVMPQRQVHDP